MIVKPFSFKQPENQQSNLLATDVQMEEFFSGIKMRSLRKHHDELHVKTHRYQSKHSLIISLEFWLTENDPLQELDIWDYQPFESNRDLNIQGGRSFLWKTPRTIQSYQVSNELVETRCLQRNCEKIYPK